MKKRRGRPRNYDPEAALSAALNVFWQHGYAGTSLDELSTATGMNRPSLYAAFGDKKSIYRKSMDQFSQTFLGELETNLFAGLSLEKDLVNFYLAALSEYIADSDTAWGCPVICTATIEAAYDDDIQSDLANALDQIDSMFVKRFKQAQDEGELKSGEPKKLGQLAAAVLHSLAIRIRAKQTKFKPESFIRASVAEILRS